LLLCLCLQVSSSSLGLLRGSGFPGTERYPILLRYMVSGDICVFLVINL
jgi:hypothetical protein